jgi:hypothetical protein
MPFAIASEQFACKNTLRRHNSFFRLSNCATVRFTRPFEAPLTALHFSCPALSRLARIL